MKQSKILRLGEKGKTVRRAILSGALTWLFVSIAFSVLSYVPVLKDSLNQ